MTRKLDRSLLAILAIATLLRMMAALYLGDKVVELPGTFDQISYHTLALRILEGHGFSFATEWWPITGAGEPTAHWSYLYTLYLTVVYWLFGPHPLAARLIQATIVGVLQPWLAYRIGYRVAGRRVGLVAALLTALYAYFIYYAATLMTEPFYITAILAALNILLCLGEAEDRGNSMLAVALGLTLGAAILLRQLFLLFVPLLMLWWWWTRFRRSRQLPVRLTVIVAVLIMLMMVPFTIYNYIRFDQFVLLNTNAGYAFFWANHPIYGTHFEPILPPEMGTYQDLIPVELRHLNEAALDRALLQRGLDFVIDQPGRYLQLSLSRIPAYFMFWPSSESSLVSNVARVLSFGLLWPFMAFGVVLSLWRARRGDLPADAVVLLLGFVASYAALHLLSWALIRYRLPVDAVLLVFASIIVVEILSWISPAVWRQHRVRLSEG